MISQTTDEVLRLAGENAALLRDRHNKLNKLRELGQELSVARESAVRYQRAYERAQRKLEAIERGDPDRAPGGLWENGCWLLAGFALGCAATVVFALNGLPWLVPR